MIESVAPSLPKCTVSPIDDSREVIRQSDVVIVASSVTGLEACVAGKPLIVLHLPGVPEVIPYAKYGGFGSAGGRSGCRWGDRPGDPLAGGRSAGVEFAGRGRRQLVDEMLNGGKGNAAELVARVIADLMQPPACAGRTLLRDQLTWPAGELPNHGADRLFALPSGPRLAVADGSKNGQIWGRAGDRRLRNGVRPRAIHAAHWRDGSAPPCSGSTCLRLAAATGEFAASSPARAKSVVGIDLNTRSMSFANRLAAELGANFNGTLPVSFQEMDAYHLQFPDASFDMVVAENSFEHFMQPEEVMRQSHRVLRQGGMLLVPIFSSIYSKYGLHLKHGLKMPWANLVFSERTIIRAMHRLAKDRPELLDIYPGLKNNPARVRDVRPHGDLNDITYKTFKQMAERTGFAVKQFRYHPTRVGRVVQRTWPLGKSFMMDVFSTGASAQLHKL